MPRRGAVIIFQYNDVNKSWDRFKTNIFGEGVEGSLYDHIGYDVAISDNSHKFIVSGKGRPRPSEYPIAVVQSGPEGFLVDKIVLREGRGEPRIYELS